jgi:hypothetical protein
MKSDMKDKFFGKRNQKGKVVHESEQDKTKFNNQQQAT